MIYMVSYDLNTPGKDYSRLFEVLKSSEGWWHYLESTWILYTRKSVQSWTDKIRQAIDANDTFIIVDITGQEINGWLQKKAWEWIKTNGD